MLLETVLPLPLKISVFQAIVIGQVLISYIIIHNKFIYSAITILCVSSVTISFNKVTISNIFEFDLEGSNSIMTGMFWAMF